MSADVVQGLLMAGRTYQEISDELKQLYPSVIRGFSVRSVRRFVKEKQLKQQADHGIMDAVEEAVGEVSTQANVRLTMYRLHHEGEVST